MKEERRLVWRVLRHWTEISDGGRFPRRDQIDRWMRGEDGANSLLIAVESPIELSHFVVVGVNLAIALCPTDTLAGILLSQVPRVVSARHGLMIEGGATLRGAGIIDRAVLLPLSEGSVAIDYVLGAMNYRSLRADEVRSTLPAIRLDAAERRRQARLFGREVARPGGARSKCPPLP